MVLELFKELLSFDSTSGREREVAEWLYERLEAPKKERFEVGDGTLNLLFLWPGRRFLDFARDDRLPASAGNDDYVIFCTHMDTVPPYIAPRLTAVTPTSTAVKNTTIKPWLTTSVRVTTPPPFPAGRRWICWRRSTTQSARMSIVPGIR